MQSNDHLTVPVFRNDPVLDEVATKAEGRPIYRDREVVDIMIAGDRNFKPTFPAHAQWRMVNGESITYAMRFADAYARFTAGKAQVADGTPLSELTFLTEAKRAELRAVKVFTAEALASLDGKNLATLGVGGRELKDQATRYLENARGSVDVDALRAELAELKAKMGEGSADEQEKAQLKAEYKELTGALPKGNPSLETMREMVRDLRA